MNKVDRIGRIVAVALMWDHRQRLGNDRKIVAIGAQCAVLALVPETLIEGGSLIETFRALNNTSAYLPPGHYRYDILTSIWDINTPPDFDPPWMFTAAPTHENFGKLSWRWHRITVQALEYLQRSVNTRAAANARIGRVEIGDQMNRTLTGGDDG